MSKVDTHTVLKLLAVEYELSKKEQIEKFLIDQEELNNRFNEASVQNGGEEEGEEADSDTESIFTQRMSVYKSRPQTSVGWTELERARDQTSDLHSDDSADCSQSEADENEWRSAVAVAGHVAMAVDMSDNQESTARPHDMYSRGQTRQQDRRGVQGQTKSPLSQMRTSDRHSQGQGHQGTAQPPGNTMTLTSRLLSRKTTRPRTATGIQRAPLDAGNKQTDEGEEGEVLEQKRPMRASAPAGLSRVRRISWQPENKSFLPDHKQTSLLSKPSPSYGTRPKQPKFLAQNNVSRDSSRGAGLEGRNPLIISAISPQVRGSKESLTMEQRHTADHGGRLPREYTNRDDYSRRDGFSMHSETETSLIDDVRTTHQVSGLKLPRLEANVASSGGSRRHESYLQAAGQIKASSRQQELSYLAG